LHTSQPSAAVPKEASTDQIEAALDAPPGGQSGDKDHLATCWFRDWGFGP